MNKIVHGIKKNSPSHFVLAVWAIDVLNHVLPSFKIKYPKNHVPNQAIETLNRWINGDISMWHARSYTFTVLTEARHMAAYDKPFAQIIRAAAHCLVTCHVKYHALKSASYIIQFIQLKDK